MSEAAMRRAVELAALGLGRAAPNPVVGCVVAAPDGAVVGEGFHVYADRDHAEVVALRAAGERARGGTAYVTLEPCAHAGRTGPCVEALLAAGVARVVVATEDPAHGGGIEALRAAGVAVEVGVGREAAERVNEAWLVAVRRSRPYVTVKWAASLDGRTAAADGSSRWVTSAEARADAHRLRAEADAVAVGVGTVLADDCHLTVRDAAGALAGRQPLRVVLDSHGRTPPDARVRDDAAETLVTSGPLPEVLADLWRRGVVHLLVEGGPTVAGSFVRERLADRLVAYVAPCLLGDGRPVLTPPGAATIDDAWRLTFDEVTRVGPDVRLTCRVGR